MASKSTTRTFQALSRKARSSCKRAPPSPSRIRQFSTTCTKQEELHETEEGQQPRWSYTPEAMKAPYPVIPRNPAMAFFCNNDPKRLDGFYDRFLGLGGANVLTDEVKWLAITHKSFDQGRRGFNDRLAFFGRRILTLQTTLAIVQSPMATKTRLLPDAADDRVPFTHPALEGLANLRSAPAQDILTKERLGQFASGIGMREIVRWKPKNPANLASSGVDVVLTTTLYAIIGAIALQKGTDVANTVARERVLKSLGIS